MFSGAGRRFVILFAFAEQGGCGFTGFRTYSSFFYHAPNTVENTFPMLEQGYDSAVRLDLSDGKISMKVVNKDGKKIYDKILKIK